MAKQEAPKAAWSDLDSIGWMGHFIPAALGVLSLVASAFSFEKGIQPTLGVSLLVAGLLLPALAWLSLTRSRGGWSFLISACVVLGIMTLFGAPKVRTLAGVNIGVALIIPVLFAMSTFFLSMQDHRYKT
jgi:hypothetical protein